MPVTPRKTRSTSNAKGAMQFPPKKVKTAKKSFTVAQICSALAEAEDDQHEQVLKDLIDQGADINAVGEDGETALFKFASDFQDGPFDALMKAGADATIPNKQGKTIFKYCMKEHIHYRAVMILEHGMVKIGSKGKLNPLICSCLCLCNHPMVLNWVEENDIPSYEASCTDREVVRNTKDAFDTYKRVVCSGKHAMRGICSCVRDNVGRTILMDVCYSGYIESVEQVLQFCRNSGYRDLEGRTDMHHAAIGGNPKVVQTLLDEKFAFDGKDNYGQTPLEIVRELHAQSAKNPRNNIRKPKPKYPIELTTYSLENLIQAMMTACIDEKRGTVMRYTPMATTDDFAEVIKILENATNEKK